MRSTPVRRSNTAQITLKNNHNHGPETGRESMGRLVGSKRQSGFGWAKAVRGFFTLLKIAVWVLVFFVLAELTGQALDFHKAMGVW